MSLLQDKVRVREFWANWDLHLTAEPANAAISNAAASPSGPVGSGDEAFNFSFCSVCPRAVKSRGQDKQHLGTATMIMKQLRSQAEKTFKA